MGVPIVITLLTNSQETFQSASRTIDSHLQQLGLRHRDIHSTYTVLPTGQTLVGSAWVLATVEPFTSSPATQGRAELPAHPASSQPADLRAPPRPTPPLPGQAPRSHWHWSNPFGRPRQQETAASSYRRTPSFRGGDSRRELLCHRQEACVVSYLAERSSVARHSSVCLSSDAA